MPIIKNAKTIKQRRVQKIKVMWDTIIFIIIGIVGVIILCCIVFGTSVSSTDNKSNENSSPANITPKTSQPTGLWEKEKNLLIETAIKCGFPKSVVETVEIEGMIKSKYLLVYKCRDSAYPRFYLMGNGADYRFFYLNGDMVLVECRERVCVRCGRMLSLEHAIANVRGICAKEQEESAEKTDEEKQRESAEKTDEEKQKEKEIGTMDILKQAPKEIIKFEKLLRGYLYANTVRPLVVSHKKYGAGETTGLIRNQTTELLTVRFMRIGNETLVKKQFVFPDCFIQGLLHLTEGWQAILVSAKISPKPAPVPPQPAKGEWVEQADMPCLYDYLILQSKPFLVKVYETKNKQTLGQGEIVSFDGEKISVRFENDLKEFDSPGDFFNGRLRLVEGMKQSIVQFLHKKTSPVQPVSPVQPASIPGPKPKPNGKFITGKEISARTNAEFLNKMFGMHYDKWYKSVWRYSPNCFVWMVCIDGKKRNGWINTWEKKHTIVEERYVGNEPIDTSFFAADYRIAVQKFDGIDGRRYVMRGLFKMDRKRSSDRLRYYEKVSDYLP